MNPGLVQNYSAGAAINPRRFVKIGAADHTVIQAAANSDAIIGVSDALGGVSGNRVDVIQSRIVEVESGGVITRGKYVTSDANGKAVEVSDAMLNANAVCIGGVALVTAASGDIMPILLILGKQAKFDTLDSTAAEINKLHGAPFDATFVIGAEAANVINVAIQLKDADAADLAVRGSVDAYLSDDANGDAIVAAAPDGGVAIGTDGLAIPLVASKAFKLVSESDGDIDLNITHAAGAKTCYLILVLPNGKLKASAAITFA